jgi:hypothetical protein
MVSVTSERFRAAARDGRREGKTVGIGKTSGQRCIPRAIDDLGRCLQIPPIVLLARVVPRKARPAPCAARLKCWAEAFGQQWWVRRASRRQHLALTSPCRHKRGWHNACTERDRLICQPVGECLYVGFSSADDTEALAQRQETPQRI